MVVEYKTLVTLLRLLFQEIKEGLKGVCHEIFDYYVFHDLNPSGPLINRESNFEFGFDFAEISITKFKNSAVCMTPQSQNFWLSKTTFLTLNLFFYDRSVHP